MDYTINSDVMGLSAMLLKKISQVIIKQTKFLTCHFICDVILQLYTLIFDKIKTKLCMILEVY